MQVVEIKQSSKIDGKCAICRIEYEINKYGMPNIDHFVLKSRVLVDIREHTFDDGRTEMICTENESTVVPLPDALISQIIEEQEPKFLLKKIKRGETIEEIDLCENCMPVIKLIIDYDVNGEQNIVEEVIDMLTRFIEWIPVYKVTTKGATKKNARSK